MKRSEYLKKKAIEEAGIYRGNVRYTIATEWNKAGLDHNEFLNEKGNWHVEEPGYYESIGIYDANDTFSDMCDFWRKKANWALNANEGRWYTKEEAEGYFLEQYMREYERQDMPSGVGRVKFVKDGITFYHCTVYSGWSETTISKMKGLFIKAFAATIADSVKLYFESKCRFTDIDESITDFKGYFRYMCSKGFEYKHIDMPDPDFYFGDYDAYKVYRVRKVGEHLYECDEHVSLSEVKERRELIATNAFMLLLGALILSFILYILF